MSGSLEADSVSTLSRAPGGRSTTRSKRSLTRLQRSGVTGEFAVKPGFGDRPVTFDRSRADPQDLADLLLGHAAEESQFHNPALARVETGQAEQGIVECHQFPGTLFRVVQCLVPVDSQESPFPLERPLSTGMIHQNSTHHPGGGSEKMRPALPVDRLADESQVRFVDQGGCLERVIAALPAKMGGCNSLEFGVYQRDEALFRIAMAISQFG